jgi:hypothetical protein
MEDKIEKKLIWVLEYFLSLHEADEIYNAIYDDNVEVTDISKMLDDYKEEYLNEK